MKRINDLLPIAMTELNKSGLLFNEKKSILKEYDGYVASFAPSVITAGLKATLSFYTDRHKFKREETEMPNYVTKNDHPTRRVHVLNVMLGIYQKQYNRLLGTDLLTIALETNDKDERQLRNDLIDCAIALKLVMRNFKQEEEGPKQNPSTTQAQTI
jgi:CRISPR/Cas system CMR-associated protein Cmr5 small subunit